VANLTVLCIEHSFEVDDHPERFTIEALQRLRAEHDAEAGDASAQILIRIVPGDRRCLGGLVPGSRGNGASSRRDGGSLADLDSKSPPNVRGDGPDEVSACVGEEQVGGQPVRNARYRFLGQ